MIYHKNTVIMIRFIEFVVIWKLKTLAWIRVINYCQESLPGNDTILWDQFPVSFFGESLITAPEQESVTH